MIFAIHSRLNSKKLSTLKFLSFEHEKKYFYEDYHYPWKFLCLQYETNMKCWNTLDCINHGWFYGYKERVLEDIENKKFHIDKFRNM